MSKPEDILEKVLAGELTRQEAIEQRPDMEDRLTVLGDLASELRRLPHHQPDPEFRHRARMHLLRHIRDTEKNQSRWRRFPPQLGGLPLWSSRVAAVVLASGALTAGVSFASASALPNDTLYPVKRAVEQVQVAVAVSDEAKANAYLHVADRRAAEIATVAGDINEGRLQGLTADYGSALQGVSVAVQNLPLAPAPLLDKVQAHVASQATELEARAVNSSSRPKVQQQLVQAEVVASNTVDRVTLVAERSGKPGAQDVHLAADAPAAATAVAETVRHEAESPKSSATPVVHAAPAPSTAVKTNASPATAKAVVSPEVSSAGLSTDGEMDRLWNQVSSAPFMTAKVRQQLEASIVAAKQDARAGQIDAASADLKAFVGKLQAAVKANQATDYTANHLIAEAEAIAASLQPASAARPGFALRQPVARPKH